MNEEKKIAVVGGGITGITAAIRLAESGNKVVILEKKCHLGGLSDTFTWNNITWDRFYHVVLSTDTNFLALLEDLGLKDLLFWKKTKSGFYGNGKLVSMSSIIDFLKFPFLSLWHKFRLGLGILTSLGIKEPDKLDRILVGEWLTKVFGRRVYESLWEPLLRSKLGDDRHKTSAAFIWATITRLYGARSGEAKTEQMGHVLGGYNTILSAVNERLLASGVEIKTACSVDKVEYKKDESGSIYVFCNNSSEKFNKVLITVSAPEVLRITGQTNSVGLYWTALKQVRYLGVICLLIVTDCKLSPYYVTNLLDKSLPFTGIIEVTNIIEPKELENNHLIYLPKYITEDDNIIDKTDAEIKDEFIRALKKVHPHLRDISIKHTQLFREKYVQPLQEVNYLDKTRGIKTPISGVYLANTTMLYNSTLNNNAAVSLAEKAVEIIAESDGDEC